MVGELRRSMADFFHEISFHELVFLLVHDATDQQFFSAFQVAQEEPTSTP